MIRAPWARCDVAALAILAGTALGLAAETSPPQPRGSDPERGQAILRYIATVNPGSPLPRLNAYPTALLAASREYGLDHCLMLAQAEVESRFTPHAVGRAGEIGLYQILPNTARALGWAPQDLYDPRVNTRVALVYLREILARRPSLREALGEYNGGPRNRSFRYADTVLASYARVRREHRDLGCAPERNAAAARPPARPFTPQAPAGTRSNFWSERISRGGVCLLPCAVNDTSAT